MKRFISLFAVLLACQSLIAQTTMDPKVTRKSSNDTYINKILIDDNYTIVSMKYVSKSMQEQMEDYFRQNPEEKKQLDRLDSKTRRYVMDRMARSFTQGGNTISFQPNSYLLSKNGQRFKFIKASSIPVSPESIIVEADKRYYFKIYFEKLAPGIETVDIIEGESAKSGGVSYWNFYGVEIDNPGEQPVKSVTPKPEVIVEEQQSRIVISLTGKVLDSETNESIAAKIVCVAKDSKIKFDSVITSKSGKYEFFISPDDYLYTISAMGYESSEESFDLSFLKSDRTFTRDFYLTPLSMTSETPPMIEEKIVEEKNEAMIEAEESTSPVAINENAFRLNKVYFDLGQASILPESYVQLEGLAGMMRDNPKMRIQVVGHTDNQGDSKLNKKLSVRRAFGVRQYLIGQGIDGNRIKFKGMGDSTPIVQSDTEENQSNNRRVEFIILEK
jgi:outer membrane protein OmpA-like peptidoglycan-associated protein